LFEKCKGRILPAFNDKKDFINRVIQFEKGMNILLKSMIESFAGSDHRNAGSKHRRFGFVFSNGEDHVTPGFDHDQLLDRQDDRGETDIEDKREVHSQE